MSSTRFLQDVLGSVFVRDVRSGPADPFDEPADGSAATAGSAWLARLGGKSGAAATPASLEVLCEALLSERGEMSGNRIARALLKRLGQADHLVLAEFFALLADRFDIDAEEAVRRAQAYAHSPDAVNLEQLFRCVEPRRQELLRRLNRVPGATGALVRLRVQLIEQAVGEPAIARVDVDFRHLFRSWFNRGFLVLREIDWSTPANVLEKIIEYEAVHAINSWDALRARLAPSDRRCFAFFHPAMPDEPLIFVEVALMQGDPRTIRELLRSERPIVAPETADTAVFYSISNCQAGLAGISFGHFLIKQVAAELKARWPELHTFRTLSPVPGFMRWVDAQLSTDDTETDGATTTDATADGTTASGAAAQGATADGTAEDSAATDAAPKDHEALLLARRVANGTLPESAERDTLARVVAHYLTGAERADGQPIDPVARFHLGNGASLDQVLPEADVFDKGRRQSAGVMVSYRYDLTQVTHRHEAYATSRELALSDEVRALLAPPRRSRRKI